MLAIDFTAAPWRNVAVAQTAKTIGKRIGDTREALGVNAAELCKIIDCAPNRWSQYESGKRRITIDIANALCDQYGVTLDWIYRGNPAGLPHALRMKIADASAA